MHALPLRKYFANRHLHSPENKTMQRYSIYLVCTTKKNIKNEKENKNKEST